MCYRPVWRSNGSRGYALLDLVVGMAVFALVTAGVYQVFIPVLKFAHSTTERLAVQQDVRLAMDRMARDLHESSMARRIRTYPDGGGPAIGMVTARAGCSGSFAIDQPSGRPYWQGIIYIVFDAASGEVRRYCDASTTIPGAAPVTPSPYTVLARNVRSLTFTLINRNADTRPDAVTIDLEEQTPRGDARRYIRTEFVPQED